MLAESVLQKFRESLRGQTFCPDDPSYDEARLVPDATIDRRPAVIARCAGAADVIACVRFARGHDGDTTPYVVARQTPEFRGREVLTERSIR